LTEFPNLKTDGAFGYGNRRCPGPDIVMHELGTLVGCLLWAFNINRPEGREGYESPVPWYETSPWVITMSKQFLCSITPRSEKHRQWILDNCPKSEEWIKSSERNCKDRWDVARKPGDEFFVWDGLAEKADPTVKCYPAGV
jgi:hypothetical protein